MANQRSPNCPQITFQEAIEKGRLVYDKEHTHPAPREVVAQGLGYSGLNGRSLSMIGALRQYGILEGSGEGMRISDDAVTVFELESGDERDAALERMLFNPPFFAQIRQDFRDALPSEANLKHYLIKHGFLPGAAETVIRVYRDNIRLVEDSSKRYTSNQSAGDDSMPASSAIVAKQPTINQQLTQAIPTVQAQPTWAQSFALSKDTKAELIIKGDVTAEGLELLKTYIELTIRALAVDAKTSKDEQQGGGIS